MSQPLNLPLYELLERFDGGVRVSNAGQRRLVQSRPNPACPTQVRVEVTQRGEQYRVRCPFCGDRRHRLYLSYQYGLPDTHTGRQNNSLWCCQRRKCHKNRKNWDRLRSMTAIPLGRRIRSPVPRASNTDCDSDVEYLPPSPTELPPGTVLVDTLSEDHPANHYLRERRFDPSELARLWGVRHASGWSPSRASNRIVIPIYRPTHLFGGAGESNPLMLAGWQARFVGMPVANTPKYLFPVDFMKSKVLYGLTEAINSTGPVYLCEGPTDVWRVGPGAVAPFGKDVSRDQRLLLVHHFAGRPVVVLFDDGASEDADQVVLDLRAARSFAEGDNRIVVGQLPAGKQDPADCTQQEIWASAATALGVTSEEVIPRPTEGAFSE